MPPSEASTITRAGTEVHDRRIGAAANDFAYGSTTQDTRLRPWRGGRVAITADALPPAEIYREHDPDTLAKLGGFVQPLRELYLTMPRTFGPFLQQLDQAQRSRAAAGPTSGSPGFLRANA